MYVDEEEVLKDYSAAGSWEMQEGVIGYCAFCLILKMWSLIVTESNVHGRSGGPWGVVSLVFL